jgi:hypothetical protein
MPRKKGSGFLLCVKNEGYPVSLETRKVYQSLPDPSAASRGFVRIIDESGEDYLYPAEMFVAIELPRGAAELFQASAESA